MRECGQCVLCCKLLGVEEFNKPPDTWCGKCNYFIGQTKGCVAYNDRPASCRKFQCFYTTGQSQLYPARTRAIFWAASDPLTGETRIMCNVDKYMTWQGSKIESEMKRLLKASDAKSGAIIQCGKVTEFYK